MIVYQNFLNDKCKIKFRFYTDKESKAIKWRDLTGAEKKKLFKNINIPTLFPSLERKEEVQKLWNNFIVLIDMLSVSTDHECDPSEFDKQAKEWVNNFLLIYQCKDVTPYMHCLAMHVSQFLGLYGNIGIFTQQGLEKLNDFTTIFYQRATNHQELDGLRQVLEKRNRIEELEDNGHQRVRREQKCSTCKGKGHNKKTCPIKNIST